MRKENPEIANFRETKLFRHILHLLWSHGLSSGLSAWLLTSVVWFYLLLPVYGQRRLLQGLNWPDLHSRGQSWGRRTWSRKSELLTPGLVNLGPGTTRHGSETLYWSQCDAVVIKKKSVHLSLASPELSPGSSAVGKLMGGESKWRSLWKEFQANLEEAFIATHPFPLPGLSHRTHQYKGGRGIHSTHEPGSKRNGRILTTGTILIGSREVLRRKECWVLRKRTKDVCCQETTIWLFWDLIGALVGQRAQFL